MFEWGLRKIARINKRRLVFSLAIIGAFATPVLNKSFHNARFPYLYVGEEDSEERYINAHLPGRDKDYCYGWWHLDSESDQKICLLAETFHGENKIKKTKFFFGRNIEYFLFSIFLGFIAPYIIAYIILPVTTAAVRAYLKWVTEDTE